MNAKSTLPQNGQPRLTPYDDIMQHHLRQQEPALPPWAQEGHREQTEAVLERAEQHRAYLENAADGGDLLACIALLVLDRVNDVLRASENGATR
jgi:hypothetical protein